MIHTPLTHRFALWLLALIAGLVALAGAPLHALPASPQGAFGPPGGGTGPTHIHAMLLAEGPVSPGTTVTLAVLMQPEAGWHGYWSNPGDAGLALTLEWQLPAGAKIGTMRFPVPQTLLISGLMNHVYEHDYAVLVPLTVPANAAPGSTLAVSAQANWLACTLQICVPERTTLNATVTVGAGPADPRFTTWRAALPAPLDRPAAFAWTPTGLRIAIPFPRAAKLAAPHLFLATEGLADYAAPQTFARKDDLLIAEVPRAKVQPSAAPKAVSAVLSLGGGAGGVELSAKPGAVPDGGTPVSTKSAPAKGSFWWAVVFAMLGGLILNVMPCVFPILSLKALALARGGDEATARAEGLAYAAGVILACVALGATMLGLRAAGEEVGWAFQLQQPGVVLALLLLAVAITANFAGLYELPGLSFERSGGGAKSGWVGSFGTGLLAAFAATPCTGPFMAAAVGAALLLPWYAALAVFGALGFGLALPFLAIGFVPALRRMLPRPGGWMDTFRKAMAVPMGLTVLALLWLAWRIGGTTFAAIGLALALAMLIGFYAMRREQKRGLLGSRYLLMVLPLALAAYGAAQVATAPAAEASLIGAKPFSEATLAQARGQGKPVFLYFTADWCLSCKVNEQTSIEREMTRDAFRKAGVTVLIGDWTRRDAAITRFLTSQGAGGVPLYLWYPKGGGEPRQLPQVLTPDLLAGLAKG